MTFNKLPRRYSGIVMPLILSLLMTCVVSAISILRSRGFDPGNVDIWISAWGMSWLVAFPVLLGVLPLVRRIVRVLVQE